MGEIIFEKVITLTLLKQIRLRGKIKKTFKKVLQLSILVLILYLNFISQQTKWGESKTCTSNLTVDALQVD